MKNEDEKEQCWLPQHPEASSSQTQVHTGSAEPVGDGGRGLGCSVF